jgi:hypothetical protein
MKNKPRILIVGDTILNRTYRGKPANQQSAPFPFSFLSEEILYLEAPPEDTVQGVGFIARYFASGGTFSAINVWTGTGVGPLSDLLKSQFAGYCDKASHFSLDGSSTRTVTRVLRNVSKTRLWSEAPSYRSELRLDHTNGGFLELTSVASALREAIGPGDICLVRALSPDLFASTPEQTNSILINLQRGVQEIGGRFVIDLRPIPPGLRIVDPNAVVLSTIGRLRDHREVYRPSTDSDEKAPAEFVADSFWRLTPAKGLICFAGSQGIIACERAAAMWEANLTTVPFSWPKEAVDGCGLVVAGDAFVAGAVEALAIGKSFPEVARRSGVAYSIAFSQSLGQPLDSPQVGRSRALGDIVTTPIGNSLMNRLQRAISIAIEEPDPWHSGLVSPKDGVLAAAVSDLQNTLKEWRPRKGQDLIAVFGESRCGKEFVLKSVLDSLGLDRVGPVNVHQFLAELRGCLNELLRKSSAIAPAALIIDEVSPGDSARSILNLLAEKKYRNYLTNDPELDFTENPVILLSSMNPEQMLEDLSGRLWNRRGIVVPPLRERWEEIPLIIPACLKASGIFERTPEVLISHRYLAAILFHDFLPCEVSVDVQGSGLDQRNFRALFDLLLWSIRRANANERLDAVTKIGATHLPAPLERLSAPSIPDDQYLRYAIGQPITEILPPGS